MFAHKISMMKISPLDSDIVASPFCFDLVINTSFYINNFFYGKKRLLSGPARDFRRNSRLFFFFIYFFFFSMN